MSLRYHLHYSQQLQGPGINCKSDLNSLLPVSLKISPFFASSFCIDVFFTLNKHAVLILFSMASLWP